MSKAVKLRRIAISLAYGSLLIAVCLYFAIDLIPRAYGDGLETIKLNIISGFVVSIFAFVMNGVVIAKYRGLPRVLSIIGLLLALVLVALFFIPLEFINKPLYW